MKISDFFENEFSAYSQYDSYRSIGNFIDGLKPTARKLIHTVQKNNIKDPAKLSSLVNRMSEECEFLHGPVSAEGVAVGLAQDFAGSNNLNLLKPAGSFGTRTIPKAAASRYIKTCQSSIFGSIFNDNDKAILAPQEFEGTQIEPVFFLPTLPLILVNGSEGIGNGFAQKILPRNPKDVVLGIIEYLKTGKIDKITPWYHNYSGTIKHIENSSYEIIGSFEKVAGKYNKKKIIINEIPIGYDLEKYIKVLMKLEDEKTILDFSDESEDNTFKFVLDVPNELYVLSDEEILNKLSLIKRVTENFTCIGEHNQIVEFKNETEILESFIKIRLDYYQKRKDYMLSVVEKELNTMNAKYSFIEAIINKKLLIYQKNKSEIVEQIDKLKIKIYPVFSKFNDYNFLLNMPIHSFTNETLNSIRKDQVKKENEFKVLSSKTNRKLWLEDLKGLFNSIS